MIFIYNLEILNHVFSNTETKLLNFLSNNRKQKVLSYYFEADRLLSLYSALLTRMCLNVITGIPHKELTFTYTQFGKPYLNNCNTFFNISHTKNCILLAISTDAGIGADIENLQTTPPYNIIDEVFHPAEIEFIYQTQPSFQAKFYEIWTRKESYLKWLGTGLTSNIKNLNSLNLSGHFHIYKYNTYINSIYCSYYNKINKQTILQEDILHYYLEI